MNGASSGSFRGMLPGFRGMQTREGDRQLRDRWTGNWRAGEQLGWGGGAQF
ncbi:hypothetical protein ACFPRL_10035 [Pseudoclavibacter helvolus]